MNPEIDLYMQRGCMRCPKGNTPECTVMHWQAEMKHLRMMVLETGLTEEMKWGVPCYTLGKANVLLIHGFKEYCALLFFKGALMNDPEGILVQQTDNVQGGRQIRFTNLQEIIDLEPALQGYLKNAIEVEKAGLKVQYKPTAEFDVPEEFQQRLNENPALKAAFEALTPGRQRGYILHFAAPKQSKTREARIDKLTDQIMAGKGLNDDNKYRS